MRKNYCEIYYSNVIKINIEKSLIFLPKIRLEKVDKLTNENDKKLSIGVYLLLKKVLKRHFLNINHYEFRYEKGGKPVLENCPIFFSLSHSGDYVSVALSDRPVGVDIQQIKDIDQNIRKFVFNDEDEKLFKESNDKLNTFYELWTIKEAKYKQDETEFKKTHFSDGFVINKLKGYIVATTNKPNKVKEINI